RQIFNIGNPNNNVSVAELAQLIIAAFKDYPEYAEHAANAKTIVVSSNEYFGQHYQDIQRRVPSIANARKLLDWSPPSTS
ncbi:MAG TPA: bifunctional UDP-4-keto-pentose/UDP-xylose synthase, partial [Opitutus sp.]|nr:bifunctional UDP-4-keto-pentose/UDP-xylose synthase [Opitutus sp.]